MKLLKTFLVASLLLSNFSLLKAETLKTSFYTSGKITASGEKFNPSKNTAARIVINERTGTVVAGGEIILKKSAISHGNLVLEVKGAGDGRGKQAVHMVEQATTINDLGKPLS